MQKRIDESKDKWKIEEWTDGRTDGHNDAVICFYFSSNRTAHRMVIHLYSANYICVRSKLTAQDYMEKSNETLFIKFSIYSDLVFTNRFYCIQLPRL